MLHAPLTRGYRGVLFAEDFGDPAPADLPAPRDDAAADPIPGEERPRHSDVELRDAVALAREDGRALGRAEAEAGLAAKRTAHVEALGKRFAAIEEELRTAVDAACAGVASTCLDLVLSFLPALAERSAAAQLRLILAGLIRDLADEERVVVTVHPALRDEIAPALAALRGADGWEIATNAELPAGDLRVAWRNGVAERDGAALRRALAGALASAGLINDRPGQEGDAHVE